MGAILTDLRRAQLTIWFQHQFGFSDVKLAVLSADASFRRYFRYHQDGTSYVLVDAPAASEKNHEFIAFAAAYAAAGIDVPRVLASDTEQGFLCLTDLGDQTLLPLLAAEQLHWYPLAIKQLGLLAQVQLPTAHQHYYDDDFFSLELSLFSDWFVADYLGLELSESLQQQLQQCFELVISNALEQPQITVHRDFHSRNIMVRDNQSLAIIDFQDTVGGPLTYDLASLLKDCYFELAPAAQLALLQQAHQMYIGLGLCGDDFGQFKRWYDLMALQRHLKVCGIFSRLYLRDGKSGYLNDLPMVISYIVDVCQDYPELEALATLFNHDILPAIGRKRLRCEQ